MTESNMLRLREITIAYSLTVMLNNKKRNRVLCWHYHFFDKYGGRGCLVMIKMNSDNHDISGAKAGINLHMSCPTLSVKDYQIKSY